PICAEAAAPGCQTRMDASLARTLTSEMQSLAIGLNGLSLSLSLSLAAAPANNMSVGTLLRDNPVRTTYADGADTRRSGAAGLRACRTRC
ncbi:MAG: hypothetical protein AAF334_04375, partial [Pseudomonadota bacterium]